MCLLRHAACTLINEYSYHSKSASLFSLVHFLILGTYIVVVCPVSLSHILCTHKQKKGFLGRFRNKTQYKAESKCIHDMVFMHMIWLVVETIVVCQLAVWGLSKGVPLVCTHVNYNDISACAWPCWHYTLVSKSSSVKSNL